MIRPAERADLPAVAALALLLWEEHDENALLEEFAALLADADAAIFLAVEAGEAVGFAQAQLRRDYVEGTDSSPVGYLEGVCVREGFRGRGIGRSLVAACERWAREKGCTEFASDCELTNTASQRFHQAVGFTEANRIVCYTKKL